MASLLSAKQISQLMKTKRMQYVESVVGLGKKTILPAANQAGAQPTTERQVVQRQPVVLVFTVRSLPNRAAMSARTLFQKSNLRLRKVPNAVVKAAARNTPFEWMMSGPTMIATPIEGKEFSLDEILATAKELRANETLSKNLLFTGLVHHNLYFTSQRMDQFEPEEIKKIPSLIAQPTVRIIQTLNTARIPTIATLNAWHEKRAKEDPEVAKALKEAK
jgi:ribosomal protein L10